MTVQAGDIVLVRTGYLDMWFQQGGDEGYAQPGIGLEAAAWLADRDVVAVGCDNAAVEVIPFDTNDFLAVHKVLLVQRGIYMLEFLNLAELAADECYTGLLSVAPLKVTARPAAPSTRFSWGRGSWNSESSSRHTCRVSASSRWGPMRNTRPS